MIRINLIRGKRKKRRELDINVLYVLIPLVALAGLFLFHRMQINRVDALRADIAKARADIERLKKEIGEVEKFKQRKAELQQKVDIITNLQTGRTSLVKDFEAISSSIPEKCWIDRLDLKGGQISLSGTALNNHTIANFMTSLSQTGRFRNVVLGSAEQATVTGTLADITAKAAAARLEPPVVVVIGDVVALRPLLSWFDTKRSARGRRARKVSRRRQAAAFRCRARY